MPDHTLYIWVHVCWSEHSDSSFVYGFMSLDYGLGTMTATTLLVCVCVCVGGGGGGGGGGECAMWLWHFLGILTYILSFAFF